MRNIFLHTALLALLLLASSQQNPEKSGTELLLESRMLFDSAQYESALNQASAALYYYQQEAHKDDLKAGEALLLLGDIFLETGNFEAAVDQFQQALMWFEKKSDYVLKAKALNGLGEYQYKKRNFDEAEQLYRKSLALREKYLGSLHEEVANSLNNLGNCLVSTGRYGDALEMHQKALDIRKQVLPEGDPAFAVSYINIGNCLFLSGNYAAALAQFEEALQIRLKTMDSDHPKMAPLYNNLGNCFAELGRTDMARSYYEQSLAIRKNYFGADHPASASVLENLGDISAGSGDYLAALDNYREAYSIQSKVQGGNSLAASSLWHKMGLCFQYKGNYVQAIQYHLRAVSVFLKELGAEHPRLAELYSNIGNCYADKKEAEQAELYYRKSLHIFQAAYPNGHPSIAQAYNNLGYVLLDQKDYAGALNLFLAAENILRQFSYAFEGHADLAITLKNQGLAQAGLGQWEQALAICEQAEKLLNHTELAAQLELLSAEGALIKQHALLTGDTTRLRSAAGVLAQALGYLDSLRLQMTSSDTRLLWVTRKYALFSDALEANFALWEKTGKPDFLETAFSVAERGKSLQLLENLRKDQAESFAGIPDSMLSKERALGAEINRLEKERLAWLQRNDQTAVLRTENDIATYRQRWRAMVADFETNYPDYYRLKYSGKTATPSLIREVLLKENQALTTYFVADSSLFAFVITPETFTGIRIKRDFPLSDWILAVRNSIQAYPTANSQAADSLSMVYAATATRLYERLVKPLEEAGLAGHAFWTIVPDKELAFLPFEALLRKMPGVVHRFKSHAYLLRDYSISYAYSATQICDLLVHPYQKAPKTMAAFAPDFRGNPYGLSALQNNRREASSVSAMFKGDLRDGAAASSAAFQKDASQYRMLLLATHGKASGNPNVPSYLAFSPTDSAFQMSVKDLYQMQLPAELVVLSACETNLGEYQEGEGVISLAKGFFHAGVRSLVATLWSVDDAKNADLMVQFFQRIKQGMPKDQALQQAKLNYLKIRPHDEAHPFYWAAAVATGEMAPLTFFSSWPWWLLFTFLTLGGTALLFLKKRGGKWVLFQPTKHRKA